MLVDSNDGYETTRAFYEVDAEAYEASTRDADLGILETELQQRIRSGARVLDVGCGAGRDMRRLASMGYRAVGVDYAMTPLQLTREFRGRLVLGDIRYLPFTSESFDAAWAIASLLHLRKRHINAALSGIHEVVRSGGLLFASIKLGTGEHIDRDGRVLSLYAEQEWLAALQDSAWQSLFVSVMHEVRGNMTIGWLRTVSVGG